jgi:RNA polymerase sigma-70 factor (ECF subfamily)
MSRMLEKDWLARADRERGKFRSLLLTLLVRHVAADEAKARAKKRGGDLKLIPIDWTSAEAFVVENLAVAPTPEQLFRRALAVRLFEAALTRLRARYESSGQSTLLEALLPALEGPLPDETYDDVAERLGTTPGAIKVAVSRMRSRFRTALREAAALALRREPGPGLDDELRELFG